MPSLPKSGTFPTHFQTFLDIFYHFPTLSNIFRLFSHVRFCWKMLGMGWGGGGVCEGWCGWVGVPIIVSIHWISSLIFIFVLNNQFQFFLSKSKLSRPHLVISRHFSSDEKWREMTRNDKVWSGGDLPVSSDVCLFHLLDYVTFGHLVCSGEWLVPLH